jgi:hypothetical protein
MRPDATSLIGASILSACAVLATSVLPADADSFDFPVDCTLGETCFIQNYFDHDPSENTRDFRCHQLTYDGHDGTDIRVLNLQAMAAGTNVTAAADGVVRAMRDGMNDVIFTEDQAQLIEGRECGNGVVIDHPQGWQTQYCHMKKGTIQVQSGQQVSTGQVLGQIGLSGLTQFPHLHFEIRRDKTSLDPFAPKDAPACGADAPDTLWTSSVPYIDSAIMQSGFSHEIPTFDAIKAGMPNIATKTANTPALVVWMYAFGKRPGDRVQISITGPNGFEHSRGWDFDKYQAEYFLAAGRRTPDNGLPVGTYTSRVSLIRDGQVLQTDVRQLKVVPAD